MSAARLLRDWSLVLVERGNIAADLGLVEWAANAVDSQERILAVLRELVREQSAVDPSDAETIGRLCAARDVLAADAVDVAAVDAIIASAISRLRAGA